MRMATRATRALALAHVPAAAGIERRSGAQAATLRLAQVGRLRRVYDIGEKVQMPEVVDCVQRNWRTMGRLAYVAVR